MSLKEELQIIRDDFNKRVQEKIQEKEIENKDLNEKLNNQLLEVKKEYKDLFFFIIKISNTLTTLVHAYFLNKKKIRMAKLYKKWQDTGINKLEIDYLTYGNRYFETQLKKDENGIVHTIELPKLT